MRDFAAFARSAAHLATGRMGWSPESFWASTVADFRLAVSPCAEEASGAPLLAADLRRLRERLENG